jgi:hypothetical protein
MDVIKQGIPTQVIESAKIGMDRISIQRDEHDSFVDLAHFANSRVAYEPQPIRQYSPQPSPEQSVIEEEEQPPLDIYQQQSPPDITSYKSPEEIRKEKSLLLYEIELKNKDGKYSNLTWSMDDSLDDLRNELELIKSRRDMQNSLGFWKRALLLSSEALVMGNNYWNPFDVNMEDWSRQIYFDVNNSGTYDEVLEEISLKYKSSIKSPPEIRLLFLLLSSFGTAVVIKKQEDGLYRQLGLRQQQRQQAPSPIQRSAAPEPPTLPPNLLEKLGKPPTEITTTTQISPEEMREMVKNMAMDSESSRASSPAPSMSSVSSGAPAPTIESVPSVARSVKSVRGRGRGRKVMVSL